MRATAIMGPVTWRTRCRTRTRSGNWWMRARTTTRRCPTASGACRSFATANSARPPSIARCWSRKGSAITENVAGIPTAVMGEAGEGGPVIAILGEYDALPGLSQVAGIAEPKELEAGGNGHGCGHNLLGSAALLAATAVKDYLAEAGIKGRVRYYGCPAEEGGAAKTFMVRAGCFDGRRHRDHLAPRRDEPGRRRDEPRGRAHRLHVPRPRLACGRRAASRAQRARCGRADECRRQLHARAHAVGRAHPLRDDRLAAASRRTSCRPTPRCATRSARATCTA